MVFVREGVAPGENGRTRLTLPNALATGPRLLLARQAPRTAPTPGPTPRWWRSTSSRPSSFDKPLPVSPGGNEKVANYSPEFSFNNAPRSGSPGLITYVIEVATDGRSRTHRSLAVRRTGEPDQPPAAGRRGVQQGLLLARAGVRSDDDGAMVRYARVLHAGLAADGRRGRRTGRQLAELRIDSGFTVGPVRVERGQSCSHA